MKIYFMLQTQFVLRLSFIYIACLIIFGCGDNIQENSQRFSNQVIKEADELIAKYGGINSEYGSRPIHDAVLSGNEKLVELLIERGALVNSRMEHEGITPLYLACSQVVDEEFENNFAAIAKLLIAKGANVNVRTDNGDTPLHKAWSKKIIELLISKNAEINALNIDGETPLHRAVMRSDYNKVELLVLKGAKVNIVDRRKNTALDLAEKAEITRLLIKHGAKCAKDLSDRN